VIKSCMFSLACGFGIGDMFLPPEQDNGNKYFVENN